ncbi:MAG TPA: RNA 2',3'-cyclic phosphodiesterase [Candidatus Omnitrophota bacterium]|nr:RNA 2',3'-cyclic phosphodiesterase [Candidatus Omnitrophota bacterium]
MRMPPSIRCFIALSLSPENQKFIGQIEKNLQKMDCSVRWIDPQNTHLTLKFLGNVLRDKIPEITAVLKKIIQNHSSFSTQISHIGVFPNNQHPQIIWLGLKDEEEKIKKLALDMENAFKTLGFDKESRPFQSHITIGRVKSEKNIQKLIKKISSYSFPVSIQEFHSIILYQSTLTSSGATHDKINEIFFK